MLCQMCQNAEATIHVSVSSPGESPVESDFCHACCAIIEASRPKEDPPAFPLSRFTIRGLMIVAGLFAILNAAVILYTRNAMVGGASPQAREWQLKALLIENLCFAAFLSDWFVKSWLVKRVRYRKTGGTPPMTLRTSNHHSVDRIDFWRNVSSRERLFLELSYAWFLVRPAIDAPVRREASGRCHGESVDA